MTDTTNPAAPERVEADFLSQLRRVNTERYHAWVGDGQDAGIMFDAVELGGEVGELLNVVKKLEREDRGWRGSRADPADFADECADVLICLDKLARRRGVDLQVATIAKFNATSIKVGLPHRLATVANPSGEGPLVREVEKVTVPMVNAALARFERYGEPAGPQGHALRMAAAIGAALAQSITSGKGGE